MLPAFTNVTAALTRNVLRSSAPTTTRAPRFRLATAFAGAAILTALPFSYATCAADRCAAPAMSLGDLTGLKDIDGNVIPANAFEGKVVFAMNVASACGYTDSGYKLLSALTSKYPTDQFVAVAIPCNSFGWQENGTPDEIKTFALARADKLLITERSDVNGNNQHPIVELAKTKFPGRISWNFDGRYVFDRQGVPVARFSNSASPTEIEAAIDSHI